jgi:hypothetical protein
MIYEKRTRSVSSHWFFDPLGLSVSMDAPSLSTLKHGRVAQLAVLGYIVPEVFKLLGEIAPCTLIPTVLLRTS